MQQIMLGMPLRVGSGTLLTPLTVRACQAQAQAQAQAQQARRHTDLFSFNLRTP